MNIAAIILAAGHGTRMRSKLPKVMHPLLGKPLVSYALSTIQPVCSTKPVIVVGHGADLVRDFVGDSANFAVQVEQLGTGHAVLSAQDSILADVDAILVTFADMPLITADTINRLLKQHSQNKSVLTMTSIIGDVPRGFGRIIRDADNKVSAIVEEAVATPEQLAIREYNLSVYCFDAKWLWRKLPEIQKSPKGEYYLTDLVEIAVNEGQAVQSLIVDDPSEGMGINTRVHLAEAAVVMRKRINEEFMLSGVTLIDPATTYIEPDIKIGQDTIINPNTTILGKTNIGSDCEIGPNTVIRDTTIGDDCTLLASHCESAVIEDHVSMGPFCHLRKGAHLANGVHMGNFGEVKDSYLGKGTKMGHFSYIGNAKIEHNVNIGAGTITCNYDGEQKHLTEIGENAFIGSDTMLVAPIKIGKNARTGAGAVVTKDVEDNAVVVGVPAHIISRTEKSG